MVEVLTNNWVNLAVLLLQCVFLEFGYRLYKDYKKHHNERESKNKAVDVAIRSLLRTEIISLCYKAETQGYIALYNLENLTDMYQAYHELGGNGSISEVYQKAMKLPNMPIHREV